MFRRGRRRKPRVQWMPLPGQPLQQNGAVAAKVLDNPSAIEFFIGTSTGAPTTISAPMVVDNPISETLTGAALSVYQSFALNQSEEFGWRLRRIVGDFFISALKVNTQSTAPPGALIEMGIIVRRVDESGQPTASADQQDVGALNNESDPWVWRRSLVLSNATPPSTADLRIASINQFPNRSPEYGTKHHQVIDQKTARRLGPEERLFFTFTAWELPLSQAAVGAGNTDDHLGIYFVMPYRVLGTVFTSGGNRRNATR